jgi:cobalt-zinc-cadmium efflux system outer membrane protein
MKRFMWAVAALLAFAGSTRSEAQILTEKQFLDDVLATHPGVAAAESGIAAATGLRRQEGTLENPELSWEREDPDVAARQDTWRLSWRLPFDGRKHRLAAADAAVAASVATVESARIDIRREMRELFAAWYVATERELVLQDHLEHAGRLAAWLRVRAEQGESAGVEARRLELEVEVVARQLAAAGADARALHAAAASWSDLVTDATRPDRPLLPPPPGTVDIDERPDLRALSQRVAEAEARSRVGRRVLDPPEATVGWLEIDDGTQSFDGPVFAVAWPVPIFDRNQGSRDATAAEAERARSQLELARRRAAQEASAALASFSGLYGAVTTDDAWVPANGIGDAVLAAFEAGEASLTDVLDSLRTTVDVRMARLETLAGALAALRELEAAAGRPIPSGGS